MNQIEKEALAKFAEASDKAVQGLTRLMDLAATEIEELKKRVFILEGLRYFDIVEKGERGNEENDNSCEPTQDKIE